MTTKLKQGYITAQPMINHEEVAWREEDGSPSFFPTKEAAQAECDLDWKERLEQSPGEHEDNKDFVAYCKQISDNIYYVYDVNDTSFSNILFIHDLTKL